MLEEQFKADIMQIISVYNNEQKMSLGSIYYILKDVMNNITEVYNNYIKQEIEKIQQEQESQEEVEDE